MSLIKDLHENGLPHNPIPKMVVTSIAGWGTFYFILKHITKQEPEWTIRMVTAVHATIVTILAVLDWSYFQVWDIKKLGEPNTEYEVLVLCLTLGYFIFDLMWVIKYQSDGPAMYFHHASSIVCLVFILGTGHSATEVLVGISGLELTNPCLQARWFLRTYGYQGSWVHILTELVFMTTFIIFRIFYGSYLTYNIIAHPKCHIVLKLGTSCLYIVSWAFIYQMFTYIAKKYIRQAPDDNEEETEKNE